jgi:hypothetical protein
MPSKIVMIVYGDPLKPEKVKVGETFRVFAALPGKFEYEYTAGRPFKSTDPGELRHKGGEEREATRVGKFPFRCFIDGTEFKNSDGTVALDGEIEVEPGP